MHKEKKNYKKFNVIMLKASMISNLLYKAFLRVNKKMKYINDIPGRLYLSLFEYRAIFTAE